MHALTLSCLLFIILFLIKNKQQNRVEKKETKKEEEENTTELPVNSNWNINEKREEFVKINSFFMNILCEKKSKSNFKRFQKEFLELGTKLYYLASEATIKKFLEFKALSSFIEGSVQEHRIALLWFAEFNVLLRKDLGLNTSPELIKDYLNIILTYWDESQMKAQELDLLKDQLENSIDNYFSIFNIETSLN